MRIISIDHFRVIAILAVVAIHTFAFWPYPTIYNIVQLLARFAVPFFFAASGYLFCLKHKNSPVTWQSIAAPVRRIMLIFVIWSCIYAIAPVLIPKNWNVLSQQGLIDPLLNQVKLIAHDISQHPLFYLLEGPGFHLWFLPSLAMSLSLLALALHYHRLGLLVIFGLILFTIGLLGKAYANTSWGLHINFNARNGIVFSMVFVAIGAWLAQREYKPPLSYALIIFILGYLLQFFEAQYLHALNSQTPVAGHDFLIGTLPLGIGALLIALAKPTLGTSLPIYRLAPHVLGIYAVHIIVRDFLEPIRDKLPLYYLSWALLTFAISLALSLLYKTITTKRHRVE